MYFHTFLFLCLTSIFSMLKNSILIILLVNLHKLNGHKFIGSGNRYSHIPLGHKRSAREGLVASFLKKTFFLMVTNASLEPPDALRRVGPS